MKKLCLILALAFFSTSAGAIIVTEPAKKGIPPRANASGQGNTPAPKTIVKPATPYVLRPTYQETKQVQKICRDNNGNVIKCPEVDDVKKPDPPRVINANPMTKILPFKSPQH